MILPDFGNDLNTFDAEVQERLNRWGEWLTRELDFDGYRLDFVRGFQYEFAASWINSIPLKDGRQRFVVGEYWGGTQSIQQWVHALAELGADADAFDFPLKAMLTEMCNGDARNVYVARRGGAAGKEGASLCSIMLRSKRGCGSILRQRAGRPGRVKPW